jgi:hypothetical protein
VNASTTTPSIKTISSFIEEGSMLGMALEQQTRLRKDIETAKGKTTKEWSEREYGAKIEEIKGKLGQRFLGSNHMRRRRRVCMTK